MLEGTRVQAALLNPEICIVVGDKLPEAGRKADVMDVAEGRSPASAIASKQDTTGILERGMYLKGQLGNLR